MVVFCKYCKKTHDENELCDYIKKELSQNPSLVSEAADFVNIAGQYHLVTSQDLSKIIKGYEGTHQTARDVQVFKRLNEEVYNRKGYFNTPESAKEYLKNATKGQLKQLNQKLSGSGQEVDWLRQKQGEIRSLLEKNNLLNRNAPGVDGTTVNRVTGETVSTTVKAAQSNSGINTNVQQIIEALKKGRLNPNDTVTGVQGTKEALLKKLDKEIAHAIETGNKEHQAILQEAKKLLKINELGTTGQVEQSVQRLKDKIAAGQATTVITAEQIASSAAKGAVIGAAIGLTISSITTFIRYKKGELSIQEAFTEAGEDTVKSALIGGAMGAITLFLPGGPVGFIAGMAIGIYLSASLTNILDEIFGKGFYRELLMADGYIMGTSMNLKEAATQFKADRETTQRVIHSTQQKTEYTERLFNAFDKKQEEINEW